MYRITRTDYKEKEHWQGFSTVVTLDELLHFYNGETCRYVVEDSTLNILDGVHKGSYLLQKITDEVS